MLGVAVLMALGGCAQMAEVETRARIMAEPACTDFFFPIYFADRSDKLSFAARGVIANAGRHARGCQVAQVQVIGLADETAPKDAKLDLSRQRAQHVADALMAAGLPPADFQLSPLGKDAPPPRPDAPLKRRADVFIRFVH
jgi:outer membrane protein OmpA-like peptidoglycan-associated protein